MNATTLDDIAAVIGFSATCRLHVWMAGKLLHVPMTAAVDHPLVALLGFPAFRALVREFPTLEVGPLWIPRTLTHARYSRDKTVAEALAKGVSVAEIAASHSLTTRRVEQLRVELHEAGLISYAKGFKASVKRGPRKAAPPTPQTIAEKIYNEGGFRQTPSPFPTANG